MRFDSSKRNPRLNSHASMHVRPFDGSVPLARETWSCCSYARQLHARSCTRKALPHSTQKRAWHGMVEVCEGAPVAVSGWVLADWHDVRPCAASK